MTTPGIVNTLEVYFIDLFKRHEYKLYTLVMNLTKSDEYAKDVVQDVFMKLWLQRSGIYTMDNIEGWLYNLTETRVIEFLKKTSCERRLRDSLWISMRNNCMECVEEKPSGKEYSHIIEKAINALPPQRKQRYRLSKADGFNYHEFIEHIKNSRNKVKHQFSQVVHAFKNLFN